MFELLYQKRLHVWDFSSFFPKVRAYGGHPLPVYGKVHMVNCWVTRVCRIRVSSKENYITNGVSSWAEPGTSRFVSCRLDRVVNMYQKSDTDASEDKYEYNRTQEREFMFYRAS